jgi:hypothetical protein
LPVRLERRELLDGRLCSDSDREDSILCIATIATFEMGPGIWMSGNYRTMRDYEIPW